MEQNKREQFIIRRIGGTTYKVRVAFSETAAETMEEKILRMIRILFSLFNGKNKQKSRQHKTCRDFFTCRSGTGINRWCWQISRRFRNIE